MALPITHLAQSNNYFALFGLVHLSRLSGHTDGMDRVRPACMPWGTSAWLASQVMYVDGPSTCLWCAQIAVVSFAVGIDWSHDD